MEIQKIFSFLCAALLIIAFIPYWIAILGNKTKPRKATWFVWALGDWIVLAGMMNKGTFSWQIAGACLCATTTFALAHSNDRLGLVKREKICLTFSGLAIVLWQYFGESNLGIGFGLLSLGIAATATYMSAWEKPEDEDAKAWIIFNISSVFGMLAIPYMTFADIAPPVAFMLIDAPLIYLVVIRPRQLRRKFLSYR